MAGRAVVVPPAPGPAAAVVVTPQADPAPTHVPEVSDLAAIRARLDRISEDTSKTRETASWLSQAVAYVIAHMPEKVP